MHKFLLSRNKKVELSLILFLCWVTNSLIASVKHPTGFTDLRQCIENHVPVKFLLEEDGSEQFILMLPNGIVVNEGGIITQEGSIFEDTETYKKDQQFLLKTGTRNIAQEPSTFFDGRLAVISSPGSENWYHWLFEILPRLKILTESGIEYDKIYINNLKYPWQKQSLSIIMEKLHISKDRLLLVEGDSIIEAKTLIVPSVPFIPSKEERRTFPQWLKQFIQNSFLTKSESCKAKRIYISRSKASIRRITNEDALIQFLEKRGFVTLHLEELSIYDQASYFNNAEVIVGPHGSGFTNLIFSQPKTCVIEIDHGFAGVEQRSFFKGMARRMECTYMPFYVDVVDESDQETDMYVDLELFESFCQNLHL